MPELASDILLAQLAEERTRQQQQQRRLAMVEKMVESWTEEQMEAILSMSQIWQASARQRLHLMQRNP